MIQYNAKDTVAADRYAEIARRMGLEGRSRQALINSLCAKINEFNEKLNIPKTLKEFGINEDESVMHVPAPTRDRSIRRRWRNCLPALIMEQKLTSDPWKYDWNHCAYPNAVYPGREIFAEMK